METGNKYSDDKIVETIEKIRRKNMYDEASIQLIQRDLESGLSREQTMEYCRVREWTITQRQIYSNLLHRNATEEVKRVICREDLDTAQMQVLYNYYLCGIPLGKLKEVLEQDNQPNHMKKVLNKVLENMGIQPPEDMEEGDLVTETDMVSEDNQKVMSEKSVDNSHTDSDEKPNPVNSELTAFIAALNGRMEKQDQINEQMMKLMDQIMKQNSEDEVTKELVEKYNAQEEQLASQQNELNQANRAVIKLRAEKEGLEKQVQLLQNMRSDAQTEKQEKESSNKHMNTSEGTKTHEERGVSGMEVKNKEKQEIPKGIVPVYYQIPITNGGRVVSTAEVEYGSRKSFGGVGIFSKLFIKKKSRVDLVSRLAAGDMIPEQLAQIRVAIERGLHEGQLVELINHNVPVEKMKEIIEIAVLENSMA